MYVGPPSKTSLAPRELCGNAFGWKPSLAWPETYTELDLSCDDCLGLYRRDGFAEEAAAHPGRRRPSTF